MFRYLLMTLFVMVGIAFTCDGAPVYMAKGIRTLRWCLCVTVLIIPWVSLTVRGIIAPVGFV